MICPTCQEPLQTQTLDNQQIMHCPNCGSTFFDENGINRISEASANHLAQDKKTPVDPPAQISCPRDTIFMDPLKTDAIPTNVQLYECPKCKGIFGGPEDLVTFKKAQDAKINYFKIWQMPLPALRAVMLFSFFAFISFALILSTASLQRKTLTNTQAADVVQNFSVTSSGHYILMSFKTRLPLKSRVTFTDQQSGASQTKNISTSFVTIHQIVTGDLNLSKQYTYQITLIDEKGNIVSTEAQTLNLKSSK